MVRMEANVSAFRGIYKNNYNAARSVVKENEI